MATGTIEYTNYKKITVVDVAGEIWQVNPYDYNGKPLRNVIVEIDSRISFIDLGIIGIVGFSSIFGNYNLAGTTLTIVAITGGVNAVNIYSINADSFGNAGNINLNTNGASAILQPVNDTTWSAAITL